jgi:hypothetical protein
MSINFFFLLYSGSKVAVNRPIQSKLTTGNMYFNIILSLELKRRAVMAYKIVESNKE